MSESSYTKIHGDKVLGILKMYSRMGAYPLDSTSVFDTYEKMIEYINEPGSYAYPGQIIAVANGTIDATNGDKDYTIYVIKSDKSVQIVNADGTDADIITSVDDNEFILIDKKLAIGTINQNKINGLPGALNSKANIENVYTKDEVDAMIATGSVDIPTATKDTLGMVKLSDKSTVNGVSVNESGQLVINNVSINNIIQESGDELILQCGDGSL